MKIHANHRLLEYDAMLTVTSSKKSVTSYQSIRRHTTEDCSLSLCANYATAMFSLDTLQLQSDVNLTQEAECLRGWYYKQLLDTLPWAHCRTFYPKRDDPGRPVCMPRYSKDAFPATFPIKTFVWSFLFSQDTCVNQTILLNFFNRVMTSDEHRLRSFVLRRIFPRLSPLLSDTLSLYLLLAWERLGIRQSSWRKLIQFDNSTTLYHHKNLSVHVVALKREFACDLRYPYLLTSWSRVLLEKLTGFHLIKKLPEFYGIRIFITAFISARYISLSSASSNQSISPYPTSQSSILILSSVYVLVSQVVSFPQVFPLKPYIGLFSPSYALYVSSISFFSILSPEKYWVTTTDH